MPWETRKGKGRYYTRSRRVNGRVIRDYYGSGETAHVIAELDRQRRQDHQAQAAAWRAEKDTIGRLDAEVRELFEVAELLARATLLAAGCRQHHRGEWRRRRGITNES
jgi:ribosomal protein L25 (general stress protein Ctc)